MKKNRKNWLWLIVALAALGLLIKNVDPDKLKEAVSQMNWSKGLWALLIYFASQTLMAVRWQALLQVQGIRVGLFQTIRLVWMGLFFNNMMPGAVGGDLLKAWYITHHGGENDKVAAITTVFVDRIAGLAGMIAIGLIAERLSTEILMVPFMGHEIPVRYIIWTLMALFVIGSVIILSKRIRKFILPPTALEKLPFGHAIKKADAAVQLYRSHPISITIAVCLTIVIQCMGVAATWQLAWALGLTQITFIQCLSVLPIIWLISAAVPVPGGLGVMEYLFIPFFCRAIIPGVEAGSEMWDAAESQALALAFMNRLMICGASLPGGLVPVLGGHLPPQTEMQNEMEQMEAQEN